MGERWSESARSFMRSVIRGGGARTVGTKSKFNTLAWALQNQQVLRVDHTYKYGNQWFSRFSVTDKGKQEFGGES